MQDDDLYLKQSTSLTVYVYLLHGYAKGWFESTKNTSSIWWCIQLKDYIKEEERKDT